MVVRYGQNSSGKLVVGWLGSVWLYVGCKKRCVGCVLVMCVGRVLVLSILVVTYDQIPGIGGRRVGRRVLRPSYDQSIKKIRRNS